jgi:hypothetical protein
MMARLKLMAQQLDRVAASRNMARDARMVAGGHASTIRWAIAKLEDAGVPTRRPARAKEERDR